MLQEYVGELMAMLFEERTQQIATTFEREDKYSTQSSRKRLSTIHQLTMIRLLDSFWSDFLKVRFQPSSILTLF